MTDEICTDVQISKIIANSREPIIVETKTTTTTTTVTKRICIANDANVDLTDIQSLLESPQKKAKQITAPPNADDTSKNAQTFDKDRRATNSTNSTEKVSRKKPNDSFLSSTKIDDLTESDEIEDSHGKKGTFDKKPRSLASNLSIVFETKDRNVEKKMPKVKSETMETKKEKCSVRSKTINKSNSNKNNKYIDGLINEYMTLERNPPKQQSKKRDKEEKKKKEEKKTECAPLEPKDLSAIFERSTEIESPLRLRPRSLSPIGFDGHDMDDYEVGPIDIGGDELHVDGVQKENGKDKRKMPRTDKVIGTEKKTKRKRGSKKLPKTNEASNESTLKHTKPSGQSGGNRSNDSHTQVKIYSPSTRGKLRPGTDNRLVLTKKMIEKKLQKHPNGSKSLLQRLGNSNQMTIDANSRLIYYPNESNEPENENEVTKNIDFLSVLQKRCKPLLVKETIQLSE